MCVHIRAYLTFINLVSNWETTFGSDQVPFNLNLWRANTWNRTSNNPHIYKRQCIYYVRLKSDEEYRRFSCTDVCLGWVLWHINNCRLLNAKSSLYIYIKYIGFGLVGFYGISTIVGYLMPNPLYTYILDIYDLKTVFVDNILKQVRVLSCTQFNGFKYCYLRKIILFTFNHFFVHSKMVSNIAILIRIILFTNNHLFAHS